MQPYTEQCAWPAGILPETLPSHLSHALVSTSRRCNRDDPATVHDRGFARPREHEKGWVRVGQLRDGLVLALHSYPYDCYLWTAVRFGYGANRTHDGPVWSDFDHGREPTWGLAAWRGVVSLVLRGRVFGGVVLRGHGHWALAGITGAIRCQLNDTSGRSSGDLAWIWVSPSRSGNSRDLGIVFRKCCAELGLALWSTGPTMAETESLAGRVLAEKYLLISRLGEGGFGSIWRAEHQVLKSPVAVKLIDLDMARKEGAVERFLREAQATAALRSPHVVQVLDYGVDGEQPFIVMELMEGENLADRIARVGPLPPVEVVRIVTHVARAMGKAHELGIVHRDLKPDNIFLVNNGDEEIAKVLDFGIAKFSAPVDIQQSTYTITGSLIGTPYYMSPEQAQGNKAIDHRSDLWALGVIAFEALTGLRPFDGDALGDLVLTICVRSIAVPSAVAPVPAGFDAWFARAVEREPDARFQSAREMALALLRVIAGEASEGRYISSDDRLSQKPLLTEGDVGVDIPSRPVTSAFAETMRDDALAVGMIQGGQLIPSAAVSPAASRIAVDDIEDDEDHLTPWAVAGIALLALASGAAAVYGVFFLVCAHDVSNETVEVISSGTWRSKATPMVSGSPKRHFDVTASGKPNGTLDGAASKAVRSTVGSTSESNKAPIAVPERQEATVGPPTPPEVAVSSPVPQPEPIPQALPTLVAPPETVGPPPASTPGAPPALSADSQPLGSPTEAFAPNATMAPNGQTRAAPDINTTQPTAN